MKFVKGILFSIVIIGMMFCAFIRMENYWCQNEVRHVWGDFDSLKIIEDGEHLSTYYVCKDGDTYIVTIHNGELDKAIQIN